MTYIREITLAYCISTTIFLIALLFSPPFRSIKRRYLSVANALAGIVMIVNIVWFISVFEMHIAMIPAVFALLTLLRKLRRSVIFSILLIGCYGGFSLREIIFLSYIRYYKRVNIDMPGHYSPDYFILPVFCIIYFVGCYFIATKLKTTYKS